MRDAILLVVGAVLGGAIGLWMTVLFQDPWTRWLGRRRRLRRARSIDRVRATGDDR